MAAPLRIVTHHRSVAEFISEFCRVVDERHMLLTARRPRPVGTELRFSIALDDGRTLFEGDGRVVEAFAPQPGHPGHGVRVEILAVEGESRTMHQCLLLVRQRGVPAASAAFDPAEVVLTED